MFVNNKKKIEWVAGTSCEDRPKMLARLQRVSTIKQQIQTIEIHKAGKERGCLKINQGSIRKRTKIAASVN